MRSALVLSLVLVAGVCAITPRNDAQYLRATIAGRTYTDQAAADQVKYLPGWGNLQDDETRVFSGRVHGRQGCRSVTRALRNGACWEGAHRLPEALLSCRSWMCPCSYITVDEEAGRSLFYVFVESQNDPATDPVVLWLNGYACLTAWARREGGWVGGGPAPPVVHSGVLMGRRGCAAGAQCSRPRIPPPPRSHPQRPGLLVPGRRLPVGAGTLLPDHAGPAGNQRLRLEPAGQHHLRRGAGFRGLFLLKLLRRPRRRCARAGCSAPCSGPARATVAGLRR